MKKIFSFLSAVAFVFVLCSPVTAFAYDGPVCAPNADADIAVLEEEYSEQYTDENGLIITETTKVFGYPTMARASEEKKTAAKVYTVNYWGEGDLVTITLDADFYFVENQENTMRCPRYYSSYKVHRPELMKSYKEREDDLEFSIGSKSGLVKTTYPIKYLRGPAGGTESYLLKLWVSCDILGKIRTGAEK